jgi:hypothetical protein
MLQIVIILGWLVAFGLVMYFAPQAIKHRLLGRRQRKLRFRKVREFIKHHHFDRKRRRWVRSVDGVEVIDEASEDRWFMPYDSWMAPVCRVGSLLAFGS